MGINLLFYFIFFTLTTIKNQVPIERLKVLILTVYNIMLMSVQWNNWLYLKIKIETNFKHSVFIRLCAYKV